MGKARAMPDEASPSTHITLRLPTEIVERFGKLAVALDRSRSWVMLRALRQYLETEGAEITEDLESLAQLDRGEGEPLETLIAEVRHSIEAKRAQ
jgi:predicted transcriptional regulator